MGVLAGECAGAVQPRHGCPVLRSSRRRPRLAEAGGRGAGLVERLAPPSPAVPGPGRDASLSESESPLAASREGEAPAEPALMARREPRPPAARRIVS